MRVLARHVINQRQFMDGGMFTLHAGVLETEVEPDKCIAVGKHDRIVHMNGEVWNAANVRPGYVDFYGKSVVF